MKHIFVSEWARFKQVFNLNITKGPQLKLQDGADELHTQWAHKASTPMLISFFAYLSERYPQWTVTE